MGVGPELLYWLKQFQGCVSLLVNEYEALVRAILRVNWFSYDGEVKGQYQALLVNLVSAQPIYLTRVLTTLVRHFAPETDPSTAADTCVSEDSAHHRAQLEKFSFVHETLQELQKIVPLLPKYLLSVLSEQFPLARHSGYIQEWYVRNLLQLSRYQPELCCSILEIVVHRLLEIDVSLPKDDIWEPKDQNQDGDASEATQFAMDEDHEKKDNVGVGEEDDENMRLSETGGKLDSLMTVVMEYLKDTSFRNGEFLFEEAKVLHRHLLQVFERVILPTHASNHTQFLLFYFCSFRQGIVDSFLDALWRKFVNPNTPAVVRQTAASYIASFVSRAEYLPHSSVTACLDLIVGWIHCYIDNQEGSTRFTHEMNIRIHGPFYSLCQAVFYIFVYRHQQLFENNKGLHYVMGLNLERIVTCRLNPLRVCLPSIVNIFATLARKFQVAYCYTVMEHNSRSMLPVLGLNDSGSAPAVTSSNPLDSFFPFDPYMLPRSGEAIEKLYRHWEGFTQDTQDDGGVEEEEDEFMQYESVERDLPLGLTPTGIACVSPGFRSPSSYGR
ncbi:RNA polymerase I-specific transcription initiation factor RRN3-like [Diadema antillarum]|uniref:RNA polymerase I-specific transcription initiation factor RRN3-like n=1 Tax=Diadema antillarum TaxID=105358 RepID=UPI003A89F1C5